MKSFLRVLVPGTLFILGFNPVVMAQDVPAGDADRGGIFFRQSCAICHATTFGAGETRSLCGQGPDLVGKSWAVGRDGVEFLTIPKRWRTYGVVWDAAGLDHFLSGPAIAVPGTTMPIPVTDPVARHNLIAFLSTLAIPDGVTPTVAVSTLSQNDTNDWQHATLGRATSHHRGGFARALRNDFLGQRSQSGRGAG